MAQGETLRITGLKELIAVSDAAGKKTKKDVRDRLRKVAQPVLADAREKLHEYSPKSAARLGISVRRTGIVSVEQRLKKTTGRRPDFGPLQMRKALIPALEENTVRIEMEFEKALDDIADRFERGTG